MYVGFDIVCYLLWEIDIAMRNDLGVIIIYGNSMDS